MTRIVIDANVLVSAAFGGVPLDAVSKAFSTGEVFLSPAVIEEIDGTIRRLSLKMGEEKTAYLLTLWKRFQSHCTTLAPKGKAATCRDPKDDALKIVTPRQFMLEVRDRQILIRAVTKPRHDWARKFRIMAEKGDDKLLDSEAIAPASFDKEEWQWK